MEISIYLLLYCRAKPSDKEDQKFFIFLDFPLSEDNNQKTFST